MRAKSIITSVNYPTTYAYVYPNLVPTAGPTYPYSFDNMQRPVGLTDQNSYAAVSNVQYGSANQLLSMNYFGNTEIRQYNTLNQLTTLNNITYNHPAGANNGKISSQTDTYSGETVTYTYDSLNRLLSASGSGWSDTYGYDGFGNLVSKTPTGGAPQLSIGVNPATNQIVGQGYDANGNQTSTTEPRCCMIPRITCSRRSAPPTISTTARENASGRGSLPEAR